MSVVWHTTMSLDGFIAGAGDSMDWVFEHYQPSPMGEEAPARTGAMLVGRRSYDVGSRDKEAGKPSGDAFGEEGRWSGPQFVFTHHPRSDEDDPSATFVSGDVAPVVEQAKAAAGDRDVLVIGADVARQCLTAGLIDEIRIHLVPVLLGGGVRLYGGGATRAPGPPTGFPRVDLEPVSSKSVGRQTDLRYRVLR